MSITEEERIRKRVGKTRLLQERKGDRKQNKRYDKRQSRIKGKRRDRGKGGRRGERKRGRISKINTENCEGKAA